MKIQRNMAHMKEQNKTPERELNKMEISNVSDAELKTLVIRMLRELTEYGNNTKEEMKVNELKTTPQETNSDVKEAWFQINILEHEEINIQSE